MELIGTLEQNTMNIACPDGGFDGSPGLAFTHREQHAGMKGVWGGVGWLGGGLRGFWGVGGEGQGVQASPSRTEGSMLM